MSDSATTIAVPVLLWLRLLRQLRRRGGGRRESGAFLVGRAGTERAKVTGFVCYDDLDPNAYQDGAIAFHAEGYAAFWAYCRAHGLRLLADVHTHPGDGVRQSITDRTNPMVPVVGHTALIVPLFAKTPSWSLSSVGVYEYLGNFQWRDHGADPPVRVRLTLL